MSKTIKIVQDYRFELVDFFNLYSHVPVLGRGGKGYIERVNSMDDTVMIRSISDGLSREQSINSAKLLLKKLSSIRGKDIKIICNLAISKNGQNFTATTDGKLITCSNDKFRVMIDFDGGNLSISAYQLVNQEYKTLQVTNVPFIISYLIANGFDMYNLIGKGYAMSTSIMAKR